MLLACSIVATLFCCMPFGIVGIVYAGMCMARQGAGHDDALAEKYRKSAVVWNWVAFGAGLLGAVFYVVLFVLTGSFARAWGP